MAKQKTSSITIRRNKKGRVTGFDLKGDFANNFYKAISGAMSDDLALCPVCKSKLNENGRCPTNDTHTETPA